MRLRLIGGAITADQLTALADVAARYGDPALHLTGRANLQVRGLPLVGGVLPGAVRAALTATGLLPHPAHELVRNVMCSPLSGISGGLADLRPCARTFDDLLCADPRLAALPGRFLTVFDDGRGDLVDRSLDLGAVAVDAGHAQLRAGDRWGPVLPLGRVPAALVGLARAFLAARGSGPQAAWHVRELSSDLIAELVPGLDFGLDSGTRDPRTLVHADPLPYGRFEASEHREVPDGVLTPELLDGLLDGLLTGAPAPLVVTPWNGIVRLDVPGVP